MNTIQCMQRQRQTTENEGRRRAESCRKTDRVKEREREREKQAEKE